MIDIMVKNAEAGNVDAVDLLFSHAATFVDHALRFYVRPKADRADIVQDICMMLFEMLRSGRIITNLDGFLSKIVKKYATRYSHGEYRAGKRRQLSIPYAVVEIPMSAVVEDQGEIDKYGRDRLIC